MSYRYIPTPLTHEWRQWHVGEGDDRLIEAYNTFNDSPTKAQFLVEMAKAHYQAANVRAKVIMQEVEE